MNEKHMKNINYNKPVFGVIAPYNNVVKTALHKDIVVMAKALKDSKLHKSFYCLVNKLLITISIRKKFTNSYFHFLMNLIFLS